MLSNPFVNPDNGSPIIQFKEQAWLWDWLVSNIKEQAVYIPKNAWRLDIAHKAQELIPPDNNAGWLTFIEEDNG